ncbi:MAG: dephospho-CoA kinase [Salinivirgaceae bacterium]|jgi:dephospho-CoA kinase
MKIVGLTGGIGCGKTFVANYFSEFGIPVYSSDIRAKELMVTDADIKKGLRYLFGDEVFKDEHLNRKMIADRLFTDKKLLNSINQLVHPKVQTDFDTWCRNQTTAKIVIKEAAILIESGAYKNCEFVILITAPIELRIKRVMQRDNLSYNEVMARIENQLSDEERIKYAHFVIENNGILDSKHEVEKIILKLNYGV